MYDRFAVTSEAEVSSFGISVPASEPLKPTPLPALMHGRIRLLHSRSAPRLIRALDAQLGRVLRRNQVESVPLRGFSALIASGAATLVPTGILTRGAVVERYCEPRQLTIADEQTVEIELCTGDLVVLQGLSGTPTSNMLATPGRYAIRGIYLEEEEAHASPGRARIASRLAARVPPTFGTTSSLVLPTLAKIAKLSPIDSARPPWNVVDRS